MGYSKSVETLLGRFEYVKPLENGQPYVWIIQGAEGPITSRDLDNWAYKMRECLYIASLREYRDRFPKLAAVAGRYVITPVYGTNKVTATLSNSPTEVQILQGEASPQHGTSDMPLGRAIATAGEQTVFSIIEAWKMAQPNSTPISFPQAKLPYPQLVALWKWAKAHRPPLMLMVDDETGSVTVSLIDDQVVQYEWKPNAGDLPPEPEDGPVKSYPVPPKPGW